MTVCPTWRACFSFLKISIANSHMRWRPRDLQMVRVPENWHLRHLLRLHPRGARLNAGEHQLPSSSRGRSEAPARMGRRVTTCACLRAATLVWISTVSEVGSSKLTTMSRRSRTSGATVRPEPIGPFTRSRSEREEASSRVPNGNLCTTMATLSMCCPHDLRRTACATGIATPASPCTQPAQPAR